MKDYISIPSNTKEILAKYHIRAKKGYGQNFLVDPVIAKRCAEECHGEKAVIEIGPGIGSLTQMLAEVSEHVTAYEIDEKMIEVLKDTLRDYDNVEVIRGDFLEADVRARVRELKETYGEVAVCANLPYYITTPVLFTLFEQPEIAYITVMVQKEVADRFAAKPGESEYSSLSAQGQLFYNIRKLFTVPGRSFNPSPNVDSAIIQFERKTDVQIDDVQACNSFIRACFKQRRKTIRNNLKELMEEEKVETLLNNAGIDPARRAQSLTVEELVQLYNEYRILL